MRRRRPCSAATSPAARARGGRRGRAPWARGSRRGFQTQRRRASPPASRPAPACWARRTSPFPPRPGPRASRKRVRAPRQGPRRVWRAVTDAHSVSTQAGGARPRGVHFHAHTAPAPAAPCTMHTAAAGTPGAEPTRARYRMPQLSRAHRRLPRSTARKQQRRIQHAHLASRRNRPRRCLSSPTPLLYNPLSPLIPKRCENSTVAW